MGRARLLFIPASIHSHTLPSLYLANILSGKFDIYYGVSSMELEELIIQNGFKSIQISQWHVGYNMEVAYVKSLKQKPTYKRILDAYRKDELYNVRKQELMALVDQVQPVAIFIDLFICTDFWLLHKRNAGYKLIFFNPMPSTYRVPDYPSISEGYWNKENRDKLVVSESKEKKLSWNDWILRPKATLMWLTMKRHRQRIQRLGQTLPDFPLALDATVTQIIANVPELLLAPLEFELSPEVRKSNQYYLGLCLTEKRKDSELDETFEIHWTELVKLRKPGEKWIYCSFGTFHKGADTALLQFMIHLLKIVQEWPHVQLICSVNYYVIKTLQAHHLIPQNAHLFTRVPQMRVLKESDVFITHGGFGSIKESIFYGVPMLVYPLDPRYDQNGNALKVEHHKLGIRGIFNHERPNELKRKLHTLLNECEFKERVKRISESMRNVYNIDNVKEILDEILNA